jgi:hypothetical protein
LKAHDSFILQHVENRAIKTHEQRRTDMTDLSMSQFANVSDLRDARQEAEVAARVRASQVVVQLQQSNTHWTLTAKPKER